MYVMLALDTLRWLIPNGDAARPNAGRTIADATGSTEDVAQMPVSAERLEEAIRRATSGKPVIFVGFDEPSRTLEFRSPFSNVARGEYGPLCIQLNEALLASSDALIVSERHRFASIAIKRALDA